MALLVHSKVSGIIDDLVAWQDLLSINYPMIMISFLTDHNQVTSINVLISTCLLLDMNIMFSGVIYFWAIYSVLLLHVSDVWKYYLIKNK